MDNARIVEYLLNASTTAIGVYMVYTFSGDIAPLLSGIAFIVVGLSQVLSHWYRLG